MPLWKRFIHRLALLALAMVLSWSSCLGETVVTSFYPIWLLTLNLTDGSSFTGSITGSIENAGGEIVSAETGTVSVTLEGGSSWTLTEDSYVTSFTGDAGSVIGNGNVLYVNGVALAGTK